MNCDHIDSLVYVTTYAYGSRLFNAFVCVRCGADIMIEYDSDADGSEFSGTNKESIMIDKYQDELRVARRHTRAMLDALYVARKIATDTEVDHNRFAELVSLIADMENAFDWLCGETTNKPLSRN